jgi:hypothetical protein
MKLANISVNIPLPHRTDHTNHIGFVGSNFMNIGNIDPSDGAYWQR